MSRVLLTNVVKKFGDFTALKSLDLEVREGEFLTLLGPSGCGKTTTLRLIAGFQSPTSGTILLGEEDVTAVPPQHREIGMVFQDYALFPHMTIGENIGFGLKERRYDKQSIRQRVGELLDLIQLPEVYDRYPAEVSGGQQQRIAVARAVAYPPRVLLMDEPLGALDLKLRENMQIELRRIQQELKITTVYVTHDQTEAMSMSDTIVVMNEGVIEQQGSAQSIYNAPKTSFVANFVGQVNTIAGEVVSPVEGGCLVSTAIGRFECPCERAIKPNTGILMAIRPENITIGNTTDPVGTTGDNQAEGRVISRNFAGNLVSIVVQMTDGTEILVEDRPQRGIGQVGDPVRLSWGTADAILLIH